VLFTVVRCITAATGQAAWQKTLEYIRKSREEAGQPLHYEYSEQFFIYFLDNYAAPVMYILLGIGVLLDLTCWRYRSITKTLFVYECTLLMASNLLPMDYGLFEAQVICSDFLIIIATVGCHPSVNVIFSALFFFIVLFVESPIVRDASSAFDQTYSKVVHLSSLLFYSTLIWVAFKYASRLYERLADPNEDKKETLINVMSEGVIIMNTTNSDKIAFTNETARVILQAA